MAKISLNKPTSGYNLSAINDNFTKIEQEFQNKVLYRDNPGTEANTLQSDIDVNGKRLFNIGQLDILTSFSVAGVDLATTLAQASASAAVAAASAIQSNNYAIQSNGYANTSLTYADSSLSYANMSLSYSNSSAASYALTKAISDSLAGGTIGFTAAAYDWGSVADTLLYFNRDFGTIV